MNNNKIGRYLSLVLRHDPAAAGVVLDNQGWTDVNELTLKLGISREILEGVVSADSKGRFSFNADGTRVRACQGHSIGVNLGLPPSTPPSVLYHGTSLKSVDAIVYKGIEKMSRDHVHLSTCPFTADSVGSRHGVPVVFVVNAEAMSAAGLKFYISDNGVWLTDYVDPDYLSIL